MENCICPNICGWELLGTVTTSRRASIQSGRWERKVCPRKWQFLMLMWEHITLHMFMGSISCLSSPLLWNSDFFLLFSIYRPMSLYFWRRQWQYPTPVLLPGKSHGQRSLVGCSPWGRWGSDTTERLHFPFSLSCIGEGNGNPLQCSCLENPRDGGAWWAAVYGVAQSRTWLKRLSRSSSNSWIGTYFALCTQISSFPSLWSSIHKGHGISFR